MTVWASGKVHFLWNDADNKPISFAISGSRQLVPSSAEDKRFIRFQPAGIAIVDQMGNLILRGDQSQDDTVTWTTKQLGLLPEREDLRKCWEHHVPDGHWTTDGDVEESDELLYSLRFAKSRRPKIKQNPPTHPTVLGSSMNS